MRLHSVKRLLCRMLGHSLTSVLNEQANQIEVHCSRCDNTWGARPYPFGDLKKLLSAEERMITHRSMGAAPSWWKP